LARRRATPHQAAASHPSPASGAGEQVAAAGLTASDLEPVAVTTTSGVHAGPPLAEFVVMALLDEPVVRRSGR
jgi:hypothetical protein